MNDLVTGPRGLVGHRDDPVEGESGRLRKIGEADWKGP